MKNEPVCTPNVNYDWSNINSIYIANILKQAGNLPLDTACTAQELFLAAAQKTGNAGKQFAVGEKVQCQKCSTPWIAGYFTTRLHSSPRQAKKVRTLIKKSKKRTKINKHETRLLAAHFSRKNILEMKCLVCKDKHIEMHKIPYKRVMVSETRVEEIETTKKKKKKKRKKEVNAGLHLPVIKDKESKCFDDKASENQVGKSESSEAMEIGNGDNTKNQSCKTTETVSLVTVDMPDETNDLENETERQSEVPEDSLSKRISNSLASLKTKSNESNTNKVYVGKHNTKGRKANKLNTKSVPVNEPPKTVFTRMKNQRPKNLPMKTVTPRQNPVVQSKKEVQAKIAGLKSAVVKDQMKKGNSLGNFLKSLF
ncbi:uncharacterized protein LOC119594191 [Penaeus monodon]|uniref:uncharacterized protein LOC119594191 n=1 Tax=Penaeus monodon TaxID=6687 RepID=UPI0018A79E97|nr:uncharacterized protein LOC119594191 [Penaeus monodon]